MDANPDMHCLESRRSLLADPRARTIALRAHLIGCAACARLADSLAVLGRRIEHAAFVATPEALSNRVMLPRVGFPVARYAVVAAPGKWLRKNRV